MIVYDVNWKARTAGPSPIGYRTELFLFGCKKALNGNPCKGCFNSKLWDSSIATRKHTSKEVADKINKFSKEKYVTIGGGEPTDQFDDLIELCKYLKEYKFHIVVYTYMELLKVFDYDYCPIRSLVKERLINNFRKLFEYIDILIDGPFIQEECSYNINANDGFLNSVGSGNQIIWDINYKKNKILGYRLKDLSCIFLGYDCKLTYVINDNTNKEVLCTTK